MQQINYKIICKIIICIMVIISPSNTLAKNLIEIKVKSGDTISGILRSADINYRDIANALDSMKKIYDPTNINVGQTIKVYFSISDNDQKKVILNAIEIKPSKLNTIKVTRIDDITFQTTKVITKTRVKLIKTSATIDGTLFGAASKAGIPFKIQNDFVKKHSYDVDFQRDIRKGNSFVIIYESLVTDEGEPIGTKDIVYSSLQLRDNNFKIFKYTTIDGKIDYYDENGKSIKKSFLRTPVDGAKITSKFGKRRHPILGYTKMHKGLDFGAPRGTPIYAAGPGVITRMNRNGGYGNYVKIKHNGGYSTAYAHLSRFNKRLRKGSKVKQGQIIGYVGTTGRSTGPHLHYEVIKHGRQINPLKIKTTSINQLKSLEYGIFYQYKEAVQDLALHLSDTKYYASTNIDKSY